MPWSEIQYRRLRNLDADVVGLQRHHSSPDERDRQYQILEKKLARRQRERLIEFGKNRLRPSLIELERRLSDLLIEHGFSQVVTPIIMSRGLLSKMGINEGHPLASQIYWLSGNKCLCPMLAPHLYFVL